MRCCTGAAGFRDLLPSTLAHSSVLNLLCSKGSHQPPSSKKDRPHLHCCEGVQTTGDRKLKKTAKKVRPRIWLHCPQGSSCHRAPGAAERKAGLAWLFCLSKAYTEPTAQEQEKGEACLHLRKTRVQVLLQHITALLFTLTPE